MLSRVVLKDCWAEDGSLLPWAEDITNLIPSVTISSACGNNLGIFAEGRWPEGLPLSTTQADFVFVEDLPDSNPLEWSPELADCTEGLAAVYYQQLAQHDDQGLQAARTFAKECSPKARAFTASFDLGRRLKSLDSDAEVGRWKQAVQLFCHLQGRKFSAFWADGFLDSYPKIKSAVGEWDFDVVSRLAREQPYPVRMEICDEYQDVVSMAYQYSRARDDRSFFLPSAKLEKQMGIQSYLLTRYKKYMVQEGLIEIVDKDFAPGKKSQTLRWIGSDLRGS